MILARTEAAAHNSKKKKWFRRAPTIFKKGFKKDHTNKI